MSSRSNITCHWFQKPTDFGTLMNFRSCAPLQQKKIVIQGTVHRVFKATSIWLAFHQALEMNKTCWTKNQYPEEWSSKIVNQTSEKVIICCKDQLRKTPKGHLNSKTRSHDKPTIFLHYSKLCKQIEENWRKLVFITRKLRSCLPTLKSSFDRDLKSHVLNEIKCNECGSIYTGQTRRHDTQG